MLKKPMMAAGIAFGAAMGGVAGLLLAPRSGRENRRIMKNKVNQARSRVEQLQSKVRGNHAESNKELEEPVPSRNADYLH